MKSEKDEKTVAYYDKSAENWTSAHGGNEGASYWAVEMDRFHQLLPSGKLIEIGSGAGKDAAALMALGYDYTGTDASAGLIKVAKKRNPQAKFVNVPVHDLNFSDEKFDGFWTAATLLHIPKVEIDDALTQIKGTLKNGAVGFISMKKGEGEKTDESTGRWFSYYSEEEFKGVLEKNGYQVIETAERKGEKDTWLVFYVKA